MIDITIAGIFLFLIGIIVLANVLARRRQATELRLFNWLLFALNLPVLFLGLVLIAIPPAALAEAFANVGLLAPDLRPAGVILLLAAAWGMLVTIPPVREWLARWLPFDPTSPVHTLALLFSGYLVAQGGLALSQGGLSDLAETAQPTSVTFLAGSELLFAGLAIIGVGWPVRRGLRPLLERLGLERPPLRHWIMGVGWIVVLVVLQALAGALWAVLNPDQSAVLEDVSLALLQDIDTLGEWLLLALAAGLGEELLFRGALQPAFGLGFTAVIFGLVHVQYGLTPITLFVVFLAVILGLIRRLHSTTIAIFVHAGYNFALGLLALLATYVEGLT